MTQRKRVATEPAPRSSRPPPSPSSASRADLRGPRVLDPFACETLAYPRLPPPEDPGEPLEDPTLVRVEGEAPQAIGVACEPLEDPTVVYRPWMRELALKPFARTADTSLAQTIARPVLAPMAVTVRAPTQNFVAGPPAQALARPAATSRPAGRPNVAPTAPTPLLHKCIAALIVAALLLLGVRALSRRERNPPLKAAVAAVSSSSRVVPAASGSSSARAARPQDEPRNTEALAPPSASGKTPQRQAVDLVARGAYSEAAALYERLARLTDTPAYREAARIARRKARLPR